MMYLTKAEKDAKACSLICSSYVAPSDTRRLFARDAEILSNRCGRISDFHRQRSNGAPARCRMDPADTALAGSGNGGGSGMEREGRLRRDRVCIGAPLAADDRKMAGAALYRRDQELLPKPGGLSAPADRAPALDTVPIMGRFDTDELAQ
jgi:hypothetical protein